MRFFFKETLTFFYVCVFSSQIFESLKTYLTGKTEFKTQIKSGYKIQYPSVSVCPRYTYKDIQIDVQLNTVNVSTSIIKDLVRKNIWTKDDVFYFVNHPGMFNDSGDFPCTTINDGTDPGKPCHFPFK